MHIQPFRASYPVLDLIPSPDYYFATLREKMTDFYQGPFYRKTRNAGLYLQQIRTSRRTYTGLVACVDIGDYMEGHIKRHELTIAASEQEQVRLTLQRNAQTKPVLLAYPNVPEVDDYAARYMQAHEPFLSVHFEEAGEQHDCWKIQEDAAIATLQQLFLEKIPTAYIADGHHRSSTTALLFRRAGAQRPDNPYRWLSCAFFPVSELEIHDFNRIVHGLHGLTHTVFLAKLSQIFDMEVLGGPAKPAQKHELTMYLHHEWFRLRWRPEVLASSPSDPFLLDVSLLNRRVLTELLGIRDVRTDLRLKYAEGPRGLEAMLDKASRYEESVCFCLYPVQMGDFIAISDAGGILPPKSTWFEPRLRGGMLVRPTTQS